MQNMLPLLIVALGIIFLLVLITKFKLNTFISLIITAFAVGLALGIPLGKIVESIEGGMGATLGSIALIFGLGAILGRLVADAGGARQVRGPGPLLIRGRHAVEVVAGARFEERLFVVADLVGQDRFGVVDEQELLAVVQAPHVLLRQDVALLFGL